jgi:glycosyltransferase involved in cell wall biosynthesis
MMLSEDLKVLYVYKHTSSVIDRDLRMLGKHFKVTPFYFSFRKVLSLIVSVYRTDLVFIWFASYHAFVTTIFAKLFSKKLIVVTGGYDVAEAKEIRYGLMLNPLLKKMVKFVLTNANKVIAVSNFTKNEIKESSGMTNIVLIYNAVDLASFFPKGNKEKIVVTIGRITKEGVKLKGLVTFAEASSHFPDYKFVIIGEADDFFTKKLNRINPSIIFTGQISHDDVLSWLQRAAVFCQLSYVESFGMGVAEAMLCECIPVVTNRGALPEVVGDTGFYVSYGDEKATVEAIKRALKAPEELGEKARERIIELFPLERREEQVVEIIEELAQD